MKTYALMLALALGLALSPLAEAKKGGSHAPKMPKAPHVAKTK